jgi:hypothetical protein
VAQDGERRPRALVGVMAPVTVHSDVREEAPEVPVCVGAFVGAAR